MILRLDDAERLAMDLGYAPERAASDELTILLDPHIKLVYVNWPGRDDNMIAFEGSAWHCHDRYDARTEEGLHVTCDELEILLALSMGELLVVSSLSQGSLQARWLHHRRAPLSTAHVERSEELRVHNVARG